MKQKKMKPAHLPMAYVAMQLGVDKSTVKRWFDRAGIRHRGKGVTFQQLVMAGMKRPGTDPGQWYPTPFETLCRQWDFDINPRELEGQDFDDEFARTLNAELDK